MAWTAPEKSQPPLHNFALSQLKWKSNHQRPRSSSSSSSAAVAASSRVTSSGSPHRSPPFSHDSPLRRQSLPPLHSPLRGAADSASPSRHSPMRAASGGGEDSAASQMRPGVSADESTGAGKSESCVKSSKPLIEYRRQSRNWASMKDGGVIISSPDRDEKKLKGAEAEDKESKSSKILIKIQQKTSKISEEIQAEEEGKVGDNEVQDEGKLLASFDDDELPLQKTWNFRPRKPVRPSLNLNGSGFKINELTMQQQEKRTQPSLVDPISQSEAQKIDKYKRKYGFTLTLSRKEIEEDMYALMRYKLSRRPKKRSKTVQKQIDNVCPGAWLQFITADSYRVSDHPGKG